MSTTIIPNAKSPVVKLLGRDCIIEFGSYENGTIAMQAYDAVNGESFTTITCNVESLWEGEHPYEKQFAAPAVVIKNVDENYGIVGDLMNAGVIHKGGAYISGTGGAYLAALLTDEWIAVARKQSRSHAL